jgi:hypothetical protein
MLNMATTSEALDNITGDGLYGMHYFLALLKDRRYVLLVQLHTGLIYCEGVFRAHSVGNSPGYQNYA